LVPAGERLPRAVEGVVVGGRLRQPGEERGLPEAQLPRWEGEVRLGGRLDAVGVVAVVDLVQVGGEDPLLRPVLRELDGEAGLGELPLDGALARELEVADELLRGRR